MTNLFEKEAQTLHTQGQLVHDAFDVLPQGLKSGDPAA